MFTNVNWMSLIIFGKAPSINRTINRRTLIILGMADACKFNLIQFWVTVKLVSIYFNTILSVIDCYVCLIIQTVFGLDSARL